MVPVRHAGFDRPWRQAREDELGQLDAAQVQDRGLAAARAIAPRPRSRTSAWSAWIAATSCSVGGNGGIKVRATDFLCKVGTEQEALDYCAAFIQLYREEARYLERTAPWIERVGARLREGAHRRRRDRPRGVAVALPASRKASARTTLGRACRRRGSRATCAYGAVRTVHTWRKWHDRRVARHWLAWRDPGARQRGRYRSRAAKKSRSSAPATTRSSHWSIAARTRAGH